MTLTPVWSSLPEDMGLGLDIREQTEGTLVDTGLGSSAMRVSMTIEDSSAAEIGHPRCGG